MKKNTGKAYLFWIIGTLAVGALASRLTSGSTELYNTMLVKPALSPPDIVFPIVWTILYLLMGIGAACVYLAPPSAARSRSLILYIVQLAFNFLWSFIFFHLQWFGFAFLWLLLLWLLIIWMIQSFRLVDKTAARLQIPYLIWVTFAAYLNFSIWLLNR